MRRARGHGRRAIFARTELGTVLSAKDDTSPPEAPEVAEDAKPEEGAASGEKAADAPAQQQQPVKISCTRGFSSWLQRNKVSLAFSSYQSGRLYLVGVDESGRVSFHERFLARAMGLWADPRRLLLSTIFQLWRFENVLPPGTSQDDCDCFYVPRVAHTTGDIVQWIRLEGGVSELFDVSVIPGIRRPLALGFLSDEIHQNITIELDQVQAS